MFRRTTLVPNVVLSSIFVLLTVICVVPNASAVDVQESTLSPGQAVVVQFTPDEVRRGREMTGASRLGVEVANGMLRLSGLPESVTGRVAAVGVWSVLCNKYAVDIYREANRVPDGNNLSLRYEVDLEGVRRVWAASAVGDPLMPGSEGTGVIVDILNRLLTAILQ